LVPRDDINVVVETEKNMKMNYDGTCNEENKRQSFGGWGKEWITE